MNPFVLALLLASPRELALRHESIDLPGPPVAAISADIDGDGRKDRIYVVDYTEWGSVASSRVASAGAESLDVIPRLEEKRELHVFLAGANGGFTSAAAPLALPSSVFHVEAGPPGVPLVVFDDAGLFRVRLNPGPPAVLSLECLDSDRSAFEGSGKFLAGLHLVVDADGDGIPDVLFPAWDALVIWHGRAGGLSPTPTRVTLPLDERTSGSNPRRFLPVPVVRDLDGDGRPDFLLRSNADGKDKTRLVVVRGTKVGFAPPREIPLAAVLGSGRSLAFVGDLGGGSTWIVTSGREDEDEKAPMAPKVPWRFFRLSRELTLSTLPERELTATGFSFTSGEQAFGGFVDLDGDGKSDLVTLSADVSKWQIFRAVTTQRLDVKISFHVYRQEASGSFSEVRNTLDETLKLNLNHLKLDRMAQFAGDFDGDGKLDFVHLGPGRSITLHRGTEGAKYSAKPDLAIELAEEPQDFSQVGVSDIDGDGRADLEFTRLLPASEATVTGRVKVDLYLSAVSK